MATLVSHHSWTKIVVRNATVLLSWVVDCSSLAGVAVDIRLLVLVDGFLQEPSILQLLAVSFLAPVIFFEEIHGFPQILGERERVLLRLSTWWIIGYNFQSQLNLHITAVAILVALFAYFPPPVSSTSFRNSWAVSAVAFFLYDNATGCKGAAVAIVCGVGAGVVMSCVLVQLSNTKYQIPTSSWRSPPEMVKLVLLCVLMVEMMALNSSMTSSSNGNVQYYYKGSAGVAILFQFISFTLALCLMVTVKVGVPTQAMKIAVFAAVGQTTVTYVRSLFFNCLLTKRAHTHFFSSLHSLP